MLNNAFSSNSTFCKHSMSCLETIRHFEWLYKATICICNWSHLKILLVFFSSGLFSSFFRDFSDDILQDFGCWPCSQIVMSLFGIIHSLVFSNYLILFSFISHLFTFLFLASSFFPLYFNYRLSLALVIWECKLSL